MVAPSHKAEDVDALLANPQSVMVGLNDRQLKKNGIDYAKECMGAGDSDRREPCPLCGEDMWIGPRLVAAREKTGKKIMCSRCVMTILGPIPDANIKHLGGK
jgi:hypothetical protein